MTYTDVCEKPYNLNLMQLKTKLKKQVLGTYETDSTVIPSLVRTKLLLSSQSSTVYRSSNDGQHIFLSHVPLFRVQPTQGASMKLICHFSLHGLIAGRALEILLVIYALLQKAERWEASHKTHCYTDLISRKSSLIHLVHSSHPIMPVCSLQYFITSSLQYLTHLFS